MEFLKFLVLIVGMPIVIVIGAVCGILQGLFDGIVSFVEGFLVIINGGIPR